MKFISEHMKNNKKFMELIYIYICIYYWNHEISYLKGITGYCGTNSRSKVWPLER